MSILHVLFRLGHNKIEDYEPFFDRWSDEEMANAAVTLCCMVDTMMQTYQKKKEQEFVTEGGIKERMTAARLGYRTNQREELKRLHQELAETQAQLAAALEALKPRDH